MSNKLIWPIITILAALLAGIFAWTNSSGPLRSIILFLYIVLVPGLAFTRLFNFRDILTEVVLAVALSLAAGTILAELMIFSHLWSPDAGLGIMVILSIIGAILQIYKLRRTVPKEGG